MTSNACILLFLGFLNLFGFTSQQEALPKIDSEMEKDGFVDLVFAIQEVDFKKDQTCKLKTFGEYKGKTVGFSVSIALGDQARPFESTIPDLKLYQTKVALGSIGKESDQLIHALKELYRIQTETVSFKKEIHFTGIILEGDPANIKSEELKIKMFYEGGDSETSDDETDYAEFFINIDLPNRRLQFREKDEEYRFAIIQALNE